MSTLCISPPTVDPVTVDEVKLHLKIDHDAEDLLLAGYISAARVVCEKQLQRTLITTTWRTMLPGFPFGCPAWSRRGNPALPANAIFLENGPVQSVANVSYLDPDGILCMLPAQAYQLQVWSGLDVLVPEHGTAWPATQSGLQSVTVDYVAGFGDAAANIPAPIRSWILLAVGDLYAQRLRSGEKPVVPHQFVEGLLDAYKVWI